MSENDNLERLNQISSAVGERDMKIWENVAHSVCVKNETEKLKNLIKQMKAAIEARKKRNKWLEVEMGKLDESLVIQRETLRNSERSVVIQMSLKESLQHEATDYKKKYSEAMEMFNNELQEVRAIYENRSQGYQELKKQQILLKKLQVEKMIWDEKLKTLIKSQKQFTQIEWKIFQTKVVNFAEFYIAYHKREKLKLRIPQREKQVKELVRENLQLREMVKQKKTLQDLSDRTKFKSQIPVDTKDMSSDADDKLKKFIDEDILPCSLTSLDSSQKVSYFNQNKSKIKILDMKITKPGPVVRKPNLEFRKEAEKIMQITKQQIARNSSFQLGHLEFLNSQAGSQNSQSKPGSQQNKPSSQPIKADAGSKSNTQDKPASQSNPRSQQSQPNKLPGSQQTKPGSIKQPKSNVRFSELYISQAKPDPVHTFGPSTSQIAKEVATSSILKPPSQTIDPTKQENISKFFGTKKKTVTFQNDDKKEVDLGRFSFFADQKTEPGTIIKDMNIFQKPFCFKNDGLPWEDKKNKAPGSSDLGQNESEKTATGTGETIPTFATYGMSDSIDRRTDTAFNLSEASFNRSFLSPGLAETAAQEPEPGPFNFFGSQAKNNPFTFS